MAEIIETAQAGPEHPRNIDPDSRLLAQSEFPKMLGSGQIQHIETPSAVLLSCGRIPDAEHIVELALAHPVDSPQSLRLFPSGELSLMKRFAPFEIALLDGATVAKSPGSTPQANTIALLNQISQLLGPLDHTLFNAGPSVNEDWITSREKKLQSIGEKISPDFSYAPDSSATIFERALSLKGSALKILTELPLPNHRLVSTNANLDNAERFGYTKLLREKLGDNLLSVLAYGSSINAAPGTRLNDYDNILVVEDSLKAMHELKNFELDWDGVPVHYSVVPATATAHYLMMNYAPGTYQHSYRVIDGTTDIPHVDTPLLAEMGIHSAVSLGISRRTSLLSSLIREAHLFIQRAQESPQGIAFAEAFTVIPLTKISWLRQFIEDPEQKNLPKREAADRLLKIFDLPPINPLLKEARTLASSKTEDVQLALAESIRTVHMALTKLARESGI